MKAIEEILQEFRAKHGVFTIRIDGAQNLAGYDIGAGDFIQSVLEEQGKIIRAYGGCKKCYGKGYSTNWHGLTGSDDFKEGEGFTTPLQKHIYVCDCDRGKQLREVLESSMEKGRNPYGNH